jgi:hypothetical protein
LKSLGELSLLSAPILFGRERTASEIHMGKSLTILLVVVLAGVPDR